MGKGAVYCAWRPISSLEVDEPDLKYDNHHITKGHLHSQLRSFSFLPPPHRMLPPVLLGLAHLPIYSQF